MKQSESVICDICTELLDFLTLEERQEHYDAHFREAGNKTEKKRSSPPLDPRKPLPAAQNLFWHGLQTTAPPKNFTPGLIPVLRRIFTKLHARGLTTRAVLCHEGVCYVGTEWFDFSWGCGYRNFLMACTALIAQENQRMYFPLLDRPNGSVLPPSLSGGPSVPATGPGVRGLQVWIENAWKQGYDPEGANDKLMKWHLVGTKKFIGTSDISIAYSACGIPCNLVDFPKPAKALPSTAIPLRPQTTGTGSASDSTANAKIRPGDPKFPPPSSAAELTATNLTRWIVNYFDGVPQPGMPDGLASTHSSSSSPSPSSSSPGSASNPTPSAFSNLRSDPITISRRMPIILQHNGHSRLIVGYEIARAPASRKPKPSSSGGRDTAGMTVNLLVMDPAQAKRPFAELRKAAIGMWQQSSEKKRAGDKFKSPKAHSPHGELEMSSVRTSPQASGSSGASPASRQKSAGSSGSPSGSSTGSRLVSKASQLLHRFSPASPSSPSSSRSSSSNHPPILSSSAPEMGFKRNRQTPTPPNPMTLTNDVNSDAGPPSKRLKGGTMAPPGGNDVVDLTSDGDVVEEVAEADIRLRDADVNGELAEEKYSIAVRPIRSDVGDEEQDEDDWIDDGDGDRDGERGSASIAENEHALVGGQSSLSQPPRQEQKNQRKSQASASQAATEAGSQRGGNSESSSMPTVPRGKSEAEVLADALDPQKVLRLFRVNIASLRYASKDLFLMASSHNPLHLSAVIDPNLHFAFSLQSEQPVPDFVLPPFGPLD
ncbi:hypothetical protein DL93DRAFT_1965729 [Clavulina sp. PMI_390]|nr:hypothetical protein DL93DRAFT_1965729 [Clavulina sp. PMI_390]